MDKTDEQTIVSYLDGDEKALAELINRHLKPVYNFVYRMSGNKQDAEDITQEVFLKAWKNIKKYKLEKGSFKTWLFSIARNTAIDHLRKKKEYVFSEFENEAGQNWLTENISDSEPWPDELVAQAQNSEAINHALEKISTIYREAIILYYTDGFGLEEISQILKKPLNTVKSQHRRALLELKRALKDNASINQRSSY